MDLKAIDILEKLKAEMTSVYCYLETYKGLLCNDDPDKNQTLSDTAPLFFSLVGSSLIDTVFIRIARLMDNPESGRDKYETVTFANFFKQTTNSNVPNADFSELQKSWKESIFLALRDKVYSHNDLIPPDGLEPTVTTVLKPEQIEELDSIFNKLWEILFKIIFEINGSHYDKPKIPRPMTPDNLFLTLKKGLKQNQL